jgi:proline iminopeptidase
MQSTTQPVQVGDIEIACTIAGEGTPLVVLHGAIGLGSTYMRALDPWATELRLVHYDQRGSGHTPVGDVQKVSMTGGVDDLEGLRQALGFDRIQVLGHSAGAYLAALYAATHPEATSAVVLLNPGPPLAPELMAQFGSEMASRRTPEDDEARRRLEQSPGFAAGDPATLERHQLNTFTPFFRDRATVDQVSLGFTEITAANIGQMPERMMGSLGALGPMRRFSGIGCPALVVHSELDPIPSEWSKGLAATIPTADFVLLEGASHFPMVEDADRLHDAVVPWLRRHAETESP